MTHGVDEDALDACPECPATWNRTRPCPSGTLVLTRTRADRIASGNTWERVCPQCGLVLGIDASEYYQPPRAQLERDTHNENTPRPFHVEPIGLVGHQTLGVERLKELTTNPSRLHRTTKRERRHIYAMTEANRLLTAYDITDPHTRRLVLRNVGIVHRMGWRRFRGGRSPTGAHLGSPDTATIIHAVVLETLRVHGLGNLEAYAKALDADDSESSMLTSARWLVARRLFPAAFHRERVARLHSNQSETVSTT